MNESEQTAKINKQLRDFHACDVTKFAGSQFQRAGFPDSLIIKDGIHIFVEYKDAGKELKSIQRAVHRDMKKAGAVVFTVEFVSSNQWLIDNQYMIEFKLFADGVKRYLETLISLHATQRIYHAKGLDNVPQTT